VGKCTAALGAALLTFGATVSVGSIDGDELAQLTVDTTILPQGKGKRGVGSVSLCRWDKVSLSRSCATPDLVLNWEDWE